MTGTITDVGFAANTFTYALEDGTNADNYGIEVVEGTLKVTPKEVTVAADDQFKIVGAEDPELTYSVDGLIGDDTIDVNITRMEGEEGSGEGTPYQIYFLSDKQQGNYLINYIPGDFVIYSNIATDDDIIASGTCGANVTWTLDSAGTLTLSGTGEMENYGFEYWPTWYEDYHDSIRKFCVTRMQQPDLRFDP